MNFNAIGVLGLVGLLSACGPAPNGAGFSGIGAEPNVNETPSYLVGGTGYAAQVSQRTYTYGATVPTLTTARATQAVLQRNGVPFSVLETRSKQQPNGDISVLVAGNRAMSYASSRWGTKYSVPLNVGNNTARLKAVSADGLSFGVVGKIKGPSVVSGQDRDSLKQEVVGAVTQRTGCAYGGQTVVQRDQYGTIQRLGVLLRC
ncbi:MAG: hypothetical protein GJ676_07075 [Rhodobacteraceae bacterium]|nr:hypothetical protein [Paracoccaceae bacterium]